MRRKYKDVEKTEDWKLRRQKTEKMRRRSIQEGHLKVRRKTKKNTRKHKKILEGAKRYKKAQKDTRTCKK